MPDLSRPYRLILASTSPRRREFLQILGVPFIAVVPGSATPTGEIDETPRPGETPTNLVQRLSQVKAQSVLDNLSRHLATPKTHRNIVIAADTIVVSDNKILGKPASPTEATQMLKLLRQQPHYVYSGLTIACRQSDAPQAIHPALLNNGAIFVTRLHQSKVWMRQYSDAEIADYVATGSPLDKAGAYGIQDRTFAPVEQLEGCFANVMGLPLGELVVLLQKIDISLPEISALCSQHTGVTCCQSSIRR